MMHPFLTGQILCVCAIPAAGTIIAADTAACGFFYLIMKEKYQNRTYKKQTGNYFSFGPFCEE